MYARITKLNSLDERAMGKDLLGKELLHSAEFVLASLQGSRVTRTA